MKVWPFAAALRWVAANHHMLRWLKTVVVSDVEKAHGMRQVGTGKPVRSPRFRGSLLTLLNKVTSKPGCSRSARDESGGCPRFLARRCPAYRRREPGLLLLHGTWEGTPRHCRSRSWRM